MHGQPIIKICKELFKRSPFRLKQDWRNVLQSGVHLFSVQFTYIIIFYLLRNTNMNTLYCTVIISHCIVRNFVLCNVKYLAYPKSFTQLFQMS